MHVARELDEVAAGSPGHFVNAITEQESAIVDRDRRRIGWDESTVEIDAHAGGSTGKVGFLGW